MEPNWDQGYIWGEAGGGGLFFELASGTLARVTLLVLCGTKFSRYVFLRNVTAIEWLELRCANQSPEEVFFSLVKNKTRASGPKLVK